MKYIEISGEIDNNNRHILHESLEQIKPQRVEIDIWFRDLDDIFGVKGFKLGVDSHR